jgi:hypothetical protein
MYGYTSLESKKGVAGLPLSLKEESKDSTTLTLEPTKGTINTKFLSKVKYRSPFCIVRKIKRSLSTALLVLVIDFELFIT